MPATNAIERLHEAFRRRIKIRTVLPEAETAPMPFWALLASGPDHHAQGRWPGEPSRPPRRSGDRSRRVKP
jgi:transposase-like protein